MVAVGFDPSIEGESGDRMFALPPGQDELIQQMAAANKNTAVVVTSGGGVDMTAWVDHVPGIFQAWYPGPGRRQCAGAIAFRRFSPSGKLPITMERRWEDNPAHDSYYPKAADKKVTYTEGIFVGYRGYDKVGSETPVPVWLWSFLYDFRVQKSRRFSPASASGQRSRCALTSQTPVRAPGAESPRFTLATAIQEFHVPSEELKGFDKVSLGAGETQPVSVTLDRRAFAYYDVKQA